VGIRFIVNAISLISIYISRAISLIVCNSSSVRAVNRNVIEVGTKSVSMSIWVGEKSTLKHLIIRRFNTWDQVSWGKSSLFNLSEVIIWILVEDHFTNGNQWVITLWPYLGHIEDIKSVGFSILFGHNLHIKSP
jgi:hypothetical protein